MRKNKGLKYYLRIFVISTLGLLVYIAVASYINGEIELGLYTNLFYVPLLFAIFTFIIDFLMKIITKGFGKKDTLYNEFTLKTSLALKETGILDIEDYRILRENIKFQKALYHAFQIVQEGETEDINYEFLSKKFKKSSIEYKALEVVIKESKKIQDLS